MKKFLIIALVVSTMSCQETYQPPRLTLSSYYIIDTVNSIRNPIVAEIDSVMYVVPNYTSVNFNNKDSILKLHNVIPYLNTCYDLTEDYHQNDKDDPRLYRLKYTNGYILDQVLLEYYTTINSIKLYRFVFTPEGFLLILKTKKINYIYYYEDGVMSDVVDIDGFVKEYIPTLMPLFSCRDLTKIRNIYLTRRL